MTEEEIKFAIIVLRRCNSGENVILDDCLWEKVNNTAIEALESKLEELHEKEILGGEKNAI